jgi:hypothetical protein
MKNRQDFNDLFGVSINYPIIAKSYFSETWKVQVFGTPACIREIPEPVHRLLKPSYEVCCGSWRVPGYVLFYSPKIS